MIPICRWVALGDFPSESILVAPGQRSPCQTNSGKLQQDIAEKDVYSFLLLTGVFQQRLGAAGQPTLKHSAALDPPENPGKRLATAPGLKLFFEGSLANIASNIEA